MVNPITTTKLKTVGLIGHSNAFGLAGSIEMFAASQHLIPGKIPFSDPREYYWKNIFVFTNAHGYASPSGTPPVYSISDGAWLEMTTNNPFTPAAPHPHPSPYAYPNNTGGPYPNWTYDAELYDQSIDIGTGTMAGVEVPLMWLLGNYWADQVGLVKLAIPGSTLLRYDQGFLPNLLFDRASYFSSPAASRPESTVDPSFGYYAWFTPQDRWDWAPSTGRLYESWVQKTIAAREAMPTGSTMSMDHVVCWFGDNDCNSTGGRVDNWEADVRAFIKRLRDDLAANNISTLPAAQIRIVWIGVLEHYDLQVDGQHATMNAAVQRIADDDPYMRFIDPNDYSTHDDDPGHVDAEGYLAAARDVFAAIQEMDVDPYDAVASEDLVPVSDLLNRIRLYYSRGKVSTDLGDELLLIHANGAMHHVCHQCGDLAYWLRRRMPLQLTGSGRADPVTLPKFVHRLLKIEAAGDATYPIDYEMLGYADGGKLQIVIPRNTSGTFTVHFIRMPRDMETDDELVPMPQIIMEWMVVEACLRLARAASNPLQIASFTAEAARLQMDVLKNISQVNRAKRERIYTQRRLPDVLNKRGRYRQWGNP